MSKLAERIVNGWYDEDLSTLLERAEQRTNYTVWRACMVRFAELDGKASLPSRTLLASALPDGVTCSICAPALRPAAIKLGELLKTFAPYFLRVGFPVTSIKAETWKGLEAITTMIGSNDHCIVVHAILEHGVFYSVDSIVPGFAVDTEIFETFEEAHSHILKEVDYEHLCEDG